jgi:hypothetical protein
MAMGRTLPSSLILVLGSQLTMAAVACGRSGQNHGKLDSGRMTDAPGAVDGENIGSGGVETGGVVGNGGRTGTGGKSGTGGMVSSGGTGSGGIVSAGGSTGTGGTIGSGGKPGTGGTGAGGTTGTGGTGGTAGACTSCQSLEQCWNGKLCVAKLVPVTAGFSIDATEVTRGQYVAWLDTNPDKAGQDTVCKWNTTFAPNDTCMTLPSVCQGNTCGQHPQPCIDWCDAFAYCKSVGKRLCGAIGGGPAPSGHDASKSQWQNACTSNGADRWGYGNTFHPGKCHDFEDFSSDYKTTVPVGSMSECQSPEPGYAGVFDLIGNLFELEDNCAGAAGATDTCMAWGGSFGISEMMPECSLAISAIRSQGNDAIGFRCCS